MAVGESLARALLDLMLIAVHKIGGKVTIKATIVLTGVQEIIIVVAGVIPTITRIEAATAVVTATTRATAAAIAAAVTTTAATEGTFTPMTV